jgi:hypothetical protein
MIRERRLLRVFFFCGAFALVNLITLLGRPSVANIGTVDIVQLMVTGACFGAAIVALALYFVFRCRGPNQSCSFPDDNRN